MAETITSSRLETFCDGIFAIAITLLKKTRQSILYTVAFNIIMCFLAFWFPVLAVCLTALAWIVYLIMGIVLTPIE